MAQSKRTRVELFDKLFAEWSIRLGFGHVPVTRDNRYTTCHLVTEIYPDGEIKLKYNSNKLAKWKEELLIAGVFHEIGHMIDDMDYETEADKILSELFAEGYALQMIREYYPKYLKEVCRITKKKLKRSSWRRKYPIHYLAFIQLPEYMD